MPNQWSYLYKECQSCHSTSKPHKGNGLCTTCYYRAYQRPNPPNRRTKQEPDYALESFANDLPTILRDLGLMGIAVTYNSGSVTFRKVGTKRTITWPD